MYSLPKTRTTQQITGGRNIEKAFNNICSFLINCTTAKIDEPEGITLTAYTAYQNDPNPEIAKKILIETKKLFKDGQTTPISYSYPNGIPDKHTKTTWNLERKDFHRAVSYLIDRQPWPKFTFAPIEMAFSFRFKLIDPATGVELPNQKIESSLVMWLSKSCVCSPELYFPFEQENEKFHATIKRIEPFLPFKFEYKYLRLGKPNKTNKNYIFTKLSK